MVHKLSIPLFDMVLSEQMVYYIYLKIHRIRLVYPVIMQCLKVRHREMDHQCHTIGYDLDPCH
jgi:hypothetical protein